MVNENTTEVELTPYLSLFRDTSGRMSLDEVRQMWAKGGFAPVNDGGRRWVLLKMPFGFASMCAMAARTPASGSWN
jgi:hypothetical protein